MAMFPTPSHRNTTRPDSLTVAVGLGGLLLLYYVIPLVSLASAQSMTQILADLSNPDVITATGNSVISATISTLLASVFGLPLAYWIARTDSRWRHAVLVVVLLPLVLPPVVSGMVLLTLVGPQSIIGTAANSVNIPLTRSLTGIVLAQLFVASPFVVVTAAAAFEDVNQELEAASLTLGKPRTTTLRRVTFPLALPGILAGMALAFARAIGEFGATIMLAYYPRTMPVQIWVEFTTLGLETAFPAAVILVLVSFAVLTLLHALGATAPD